MKHLLIVLLLLAAPVAVLAQTASVQLGWDANSASTSNSPLTYKAYWGGSTTNYTNSVLSGTNTSAIVPNLALGGTYHFSVTATDTNGLESAYAPDLAYTLPTPPSPPTGLSVTAIITVNVNVNVSSKK